METILQLRARPISNDPASFAFDPYTAGSRSGAFGVFQFVSADGSVCSVPVAVAVPLYRHSRRYLRSHSAQMPLRMWTTCRTRCICHAYGLGYRLPFRDGNASPRILETGRENCWQ